MIAATHGYVMGLAFGIMIECDLIVAEAGTKLQVTETSRGLGASRYWGLMQFRGGAAFGTEMALTGRFFSAKRSRRGSSTEWRQRAPISTWHVRWLTRSTKIRH